MKQVAGTVRAGANWLVLLRLFYANCGHEARLSGRLRPAGGQIAKFARQSSFHAKAKGRRKTVFL
jgi:hypothetical protein